MYPITYGFTGLQFGIANAETGVILVSFTRTADVSQKEVRDNLGNIVGVGSYGPTAKYDLNATYLFNVAGSIAAVSVGTSIILNNIQNTQGVSGGHTILKTVTEDFSAEDYVKVKLSATQFPSV